MNFFKKRWVAWTLCILMILSGLFVGYYKQVQSQYAPGSQTEAEKWGWDNFSTYERYLVDDTEALSKKEKKLLSVYNASFDYTYDSVFGIWITESTEGHIVPEENQQARKALGLGERDYLLLLDCSEHLWFLYPGTEAAKHQTHTLDLMVTEACNLFFEGNPSAFLQLFSELEDWHQKNTPPVNYTSHLMQTVKAIGKTATYMLVIGFVAVGILVFVVIYFIRKIFLQHTKQATVFHRQKASKRASERYSEATKTQYSSEHVQKTRVHKKE